MSASGNVAADQPLPGNASSVASEPRTPGSTRGAGVGAGLGSPGGNAGGNATPTGNTGGAAPSMQQLMALMVQQSQALLNLQASQQAQTPPTAGGGLNMSSPLSRAVDLRGMLKCEEFAGGRS